MPVNGETRSLPRRWRQRSGGGLLLPDRMYNPQGTEIIADEFDDASIDSNWTRVDKSSSTYVTWTESGGVMSAKHTSSASGNSQAHALMWELPAGTTFPITIESYFHGTVQYNVNYLMMGLIFSDGLSLSGTNQIVSMPYCNSSSVHALYQDVRSANGFLIDNQEVGGQLYGHASIGFYNQLVWSASNTFFMRTSSDGVSWKDSGSSTAQACTPTHVGIWNTNWGGAYPYQVGYEYFRVYADSNPEGDVDTL